MTVGTRVTHKRYPWLIGYVTSPGMGLLLHVCWANDALGHVTLEDERELRATPVQP